MTLIRALAPFSVTTLMTALVLSACTPVGPDFQKPQAQQAPADYLATQESGRDGRAGVLRDWTQLLPDEQFQHLLKTALTHNADVQMALARLSQARAQQGVQEGTTGPNLEAAAKISDDRLSTHSEMFANLPPGMAVKNQFDNRQVGFDASWELDLFGYQRRLNQGAQARTESVRWHLDDVRLSLAAEVARNYVELRLNQQRTLLLQSQIELLAKSLRITEQAALAGEVAQPEVERLRNALHNLQAGEPLLAQARRQNLLTLSVLTDLPTAQLKQTLDEDIRSSTVPAVPSPPASGLPADLMRHRPDVKAAERDWAAANADVGVAVALQYPRVTLVGAAGWNSVRSNTLFDNASRLWSVGPELSLPIFESGRLKNQEQAARANLQAAQVQYHKTLLSAVTDVDGALQRLAQNEQRRMKLLEAEQAQVKLLQLTERQQAAGEVSLQTLLDTQRALSVQKDLSAQAQAQCVLDVVALYKALGGDWIEE